MFIIKYFNTTEIDLFLIILYYYFCKSAVVNFLFPYKSIAGKTSKISARSKSLIIPGILKFSDMGRYASEPDNATKAAKAKGSNLRVHFKVNIK